MEQTTFATIADFYAQRGGEHSGESDFGVWWWDASDNDQGLIAAGLKTPRGPFYRVSVVHDTGDVYAVDAWKGLVELLGHFEPNCVAGESLLHHGEACAYEQAERALAGWAEGGNKPLGWVRSRLVGPFDTRMGQP